LTSDEFVEMAKYYISDQIANEGNALNILKRLEMVVQKHCLDASDKDKVYSNKMDKAYSN
jgi:hypothetical protein